MVRRRSKKMLSDDMVDMRRSRRRTRRSRNMRRSKNMRRSRNMRRSKRKRRSRVRSQKGVVGRLRRKPVWNKGYYWDTNLEKWEFSYEKEIPQEWTDIINKKTDTFNHGDNVNLDIKMVRRPPGDWDNEDTYLAMDEGRQHRIIEFFEKSGNFYIEGDLVTEMSGIETFKVVNEDGTDIYVEPRCLNKV